MISQRESALTIDRYHRPIDFTAAEIDDPIESLRALLSATKDRHDRPGFTAGNRLGIFLWAETLLNQDILDAQLSLSGPWRAQIQELIDRAQKAGRFDEDMDAEGMGVLMIAAYIGLNVQSAWEGRVPYEKGWRALEALLNSATREAPAGET